VRVEAKGVNGASVCAFARHAASHVGPWLTEAKADGKEVLAVFVSSFHHC
jgi:hypothetical protein